MKWGEYSNDVQFILQWSESNRPLLQPTPVRAKIPSSTPSSPSTSSISVETSDKQRDIQKPTSLRYL